MNARQDVNLTDIMQREAIKRVERSAGRFVVELMDGRIGVGGSAGEALERAKAPDAVNIRRAA